MKRITSILLLCIFALSASAQSLYQPSQIGAGTRNQKVAKGFQVEDTLLAKGIVWFPKTPNVSSLLFDSVGVFYNGFFYKIHKDSLGFININIYNSDGTLTGDRYVNANDDSLIFYNAKSLLINNTGLPNSNATGKTAVASLTSDTSNFSALQLLGINTGHKYGTHIFGQSYNTNTDVASSGVLMTGIGQSGINITGTGDSLGGVAILGTTNDNNGVSIIGMTGDISDAATDIYGENSSGGPGVWVEGRADAGFADIVLFPINSDLQLKNITQDNAANKVMVMDSDSMVRFRDASTLSGVDTLSIFSVYDTDSLRIYLGNGNYTAFAYGVDSVGQTASGDSMIVYKGGTRYAYVNGTVTFGLNAGEDSIILVHNGQRFAVAYSVGGGGAISQLTAATATNSIDNAAYEQAWYWNTLAGGVGLHLEATTTAAASNTQTLFKSLLRGANATNNQTTYAAQIINRHTNNLGSTNIGLYIDVDSATTANLPLSIKGPGATEPLFKLDGTSKSYLQFFRNGVAKSYIGEWYAGSNVLMINMPDAGSIYMGASNTADFIFENKRLGINCSPGYPLEVSGPAGLAIGLRLRVGGFWADAAQDQVFTHLRAGQAGNFGLNSSGTLIIGCNGSGSGTQIAIEAGKQVGIGTTNPSDNAMLDIQSTSRGILIPRMTTAQRDAGTHDSWTMIICTDCTAGDASTGVLQVWNGSAWKNAW